MNGYFEVSSNNGKLCIKLFPPSEGCEAIRRDELVEYLSLKNVMYDPKTLMNALINLHEPTVVQTETASRMAEGEFVKVIISPDNMEAKVRLIPPFCGGPKMDKTEFMRELSSRAIASGIQEDAISELLSKRNYCTDVVVAIGTPPVQGKDAEIEYYFNTDPKVRPTLNEDGSVDFFHLNTINHCQAGDMLARLFPASQGAVGINIKGERIRPHEVKNATLKFGNNIEISADRTILTSAVDGHVALVDDKVFVSNVLEVENVDNSVGNIDYEGSVKVNGNVCENFTVKAKGNIEVRGVVEGARLESGGDIIIARGMNGMRKGVLKAEGNVISKFLENAEVNAGGYVETESVLHSRVMAGSEIRVTAKKGFITGGRVSAAQCIQVKNLGSPMGADTIVEVGADPAMKQKVQQLQKEIADLTKALATIRPVLDGAKQKLQSGIKMSTEQLLQIQKLALANRDQSAKLEECSSELKKYQEFTDCETTGQVIVTGDVYPGTKICIGDVSMVVKSSMKYCRFVKEAGDVKMTAIY